MLPREKLTQRDAVEKYFCIPFESVPQIPLDKETMEILAKMLLSPPLAPDKLEGADKPFVLRIAQNYLDVFPVKISDGRLLLFLAVISKGSPGHIIMFVTYLQYWSHKYSKSFLDITIFCKHIFPWGLPSDVELTKLWDGQKTEGGNLLDHMECFHSIL